MKILVTGGAGFIGSNFIHYWLGEHPSDEIVNLDLLTYAGSLENLASLGDNHVFVKGDICDGGLVDRLLAQGIDLIVHFAAESHVDRSIADPGVFVRTNVLGTQVLLEAALRHGVRFHHVSTDEVFGSLCASDPRFNEQTPYAPRSPYSASKAASDHLVRAYYHTYGLPVTISNCSNTYGPRQHREKLIPLAITNLLTGKKIPIYGEGENIRDWIYVDDHNAGLKAILERGEVGETYCLGGNNEMSNLNVVRTILRLMGKDADDVEYVTDRKGHDFRYAVDFSKAKRELGWEPTTEFEDGVRKTIGWYVDLPNCKLKGEI